MKLLKYLAARVPVKIAPVTGPAQVTETPATAPQPVRFVRRPAVDIRKPGVY